MHYQSQLYAERHRQPAESCFDQLFNHVQIFQTTGRLQTALQAAPANEGAGHGSAVHAVEKQHPHRPSDFAEFQQHRRRPLFECDPVRVHEVTFGTFDAPDGRREPFRGMQRNPRREWL